MATKVVGEKRNRSINFSISETECLINEVVKRASVIENKTTDAVTWKEKEEKWNEVTNAFNILTGGTRTVKMLKTKYDGIKRSIKAKAARMKAERFKTGGGPPVDVRFSLWEEKLLQFMSLRVDGLPHQNDSDIAIRHSQNACPSTSQSEEIIVEIENPMVDIENAMVDIDGPSVVFEYQPMIEEDFTVLPSTSGLGANVNQDEIIIEQPPSTNSPSSRETKWSSWTPKSLRTPINKKLKAPLIQDKYVEMSKAREDLILTQKKVAEEDLANKALEKENLLLKKAYITTISEKKIEKIEMEKKNLRRDEERKEELHALQMKMLREKN